MAARSCLSTKETGVEKTCDGAGGLGKKKKEEKKSQWNKLTTAGGVCAATSPSSFLLYRLYVEKEWKEKKYFTILISIFVYKSENSPFDVGCPVRPQDNYTVHAYTYRVGIRILIFEKPNHRRLAARRYIIFIFDALTHNVRHIR